MEPGYVTYSPIIDRPAIKWPNNARVALWVSPNVEFYEFQPPLNTYRDAWTRVPPPDVMGYGYRDYGNRVGFWRLLEVLDQYRVRATVSLNMAVLDHFPEIRDAMVARDWAFMSHGIYNTRYLFGMSADEERAFYQDCIRTLHSHTGKQLKGMLGPAFSATPNTPELMAEAGLIYTADWFIDDQPFPFNVKTGRLVGVPYGKEINDSFLSGFEDFAQTCKDHFDTLYEEGAEGGRVMCIALHPFITGQPHRVQHLGDVLAYILSHEGVWATTADDIAEYYMANYYEAEVARLS